MKKERALFIGVFILIILIFSFNSFDKFLLMDPGDGNCVITKARWEVAEDIFVEEKEPLLLNITSSSCRKYGNSIGEFMGLLAETGKTAFPVGRGVLDNPNVNGADNPSVFYDDNGTLFLIFGDPNGDGGVFRDGAMAFTSEIVPEKNLDLKHNRNWAVRSDDYNNDGYYDAASLAGKAGYTRVNNIGGAVLDLPDGRKRILFMAYFYISQPTNPQRVQLLYSDDNFETMAVNNPELIFWDYSDGGYGAYAPHVFLGYSMRRLGDYIYIAMPRSGSGNLVMFRANVGDLIKSDLSLSDWEYLNSTNASGYASWIKGVERGQISLAWDDEKYIPPVNFSSAPSILSSIHWNPYLNKWIAMDTIYVNTWESDYYWGPYTNITFINHYPYFNGYNAFTHETLLGENGRDIYYARSRWPSSGYYGTYWFKARMTPLMEIELSQKSAVRGNNISITVTDNSGDVREADFYVGVDGWKADYTKSEGNKHFFSYVVSGEENNGGVGVVNVAAYKIYRNSPINASNMREVALAVNHRNDLHLDITSHAENEIVSGTVIINASAWYDTAVEENSEGKPEVYVIRTVLESTENEMVEDADVLAPYSLKLDTSRYENGLHEFKITVYDTIDRKAEKIIRLNIQNGAAPAVAGNYLSDGDMEADGTSSWMSYTSGALLKVSDGRQRNGKQSLLIINNDSAGTGEYRGMQQIVSGLSGGESLYYSVWAKMHQNITSKTPSDIFAGEYLNNSFYCGIYAPGYNWLDICYNYYSPFSYFIKCGRQITNPSGNTDLYFICAVRERNVDAGRIELIIDDAVLRDASYPVVEDATNLNLDLIDGRVELSWEFARDLNVEYYYIYRKLIGGTYEKIGEVRDYMRSFSDDVSSLASVEYVYKVVSVDEMAKESNGVEIGFVK